MSERMNNHMINTLRDIKTELKRDGLTAEQKIERIGLLIGLLESVECGETIMGE